jgi:cobalt-zinc-cadmium efflux system membrane fusion protein
LRPGTFGRAVIKTAAQGATLPAEAVLLRGGKDWIVYVAKSDDTFERRSVVAGRPIDGRVQVLSGLTPGDRVVIHGALLLDGSAEQLL